MSSGVPDGWSVYALGELGEVVGGGTPHSETPSYWGGSVMWATPAEITKLKSRYINKTLRTITRAGLQKSSAKLHPKGTILLTSRASIGYPAINTVPMATNQGFQSLRPNEKLDVEYGYQLISNHRNGLERLSAGSTFLEISSKEIRNYKFPIPPLSEQKKIASILTSVDEVIENTQKQIDKLQDLKRATMNELLTKGIGHTEFKDSELGQIPNSWDVVTLRNVCRRVCVGFVGTCEPYYRPTGIPLIRTSDLKGGLSEIVNGKYVTKEFHEKEKKSQLFSGDLLIARHGDFGQTCLVPEGFGEANCLNIVIVRPDTQFYTPKFLKYLFNSDSMKRRFEAKAEGSTQKVISTTEISRAVLPMPTLTEQDSIIQVLESLDSSIDAKKVKLSQTQSLKKSLMQDLLTGKVRVTVTDGI